MKEFLSTLVHKNFPSQHIKYAFGYGSAVFKQANYHQADKQQVIDAILIVDDTQKFHEQNMDMNGRHYSYYTKRLPTSVTNWVNNSGSKMYFNPLIPMKTFIYEGS
jgi:Phosphatidate cytidylyltransferase, mitochondrial